MAERLDFELPEFQRLLWANPRARETWEPRIHAVAKAWVEIERIAVAHGEKPATLQVCSPEELPVISEWCALRGLTCIPLSRQGVSDGYASRTKGLSSEDRWQYRIVIARHETAVLFVDLWKDQDNERIGAALGFPECCRAFFQKYWVDESWNDTTLPMLGDLHANGHSSVRVGGSLECNILLRWLGIRLVSHLPCSFYCDETSRIGERLGLMGLRAGYVQEMDWLTQMLSWPVKWSSLHGVAIITTPVFKLIVDSTPLQEKVEVLRDGPTYPEEGARGTEFPFQDRTKLSISRPTDYKDNGFSSKEAMDNSHKAVVAAVMRSVSERTDFGKIIDLGCGNGALLEKILAQASWLVPCGVEQDEEKHQRAARRLLSYDPDLHLGDLFGHAYWNPPYSVALLSLNRLQEVEPERALALLTRLRDGCHRVVLYSYLHKEWPGFEGCSELFELEAHFDLNTSCAIVLEPKRDNDYDPVQG